MTTELHTSSTIDPETTKLGAAEDCDPAGDRPTPSEGKLRMAWRIVQVRLRLIALFAIAFLVVGKWHLLRGYWDKWTTSSVESRSQNVAQGIEYFCPMDPGVISDWPSKCPICNMTLVQRKVGDMPVLPEGVVARMQFSPYRVQIAGVRTSPVSYQPLTYDIHCAGRLTPQVQRTQRMLAPVEGVLEATLETSTTIDAREGERLATLYTSLPAAQTEKNLAAAFGGDGSKRRFELSGRQGTGSQIALLAPFAGEILQWHASPGDRLERSTPICTVADLTKLTLSTVVSDRELPLLSHAHAVEITCDALPRGSFVAGQIQRVAAKETPAGWISEVQIEVDNAERKLRPGMYVSASIRVLASAVEPFASLPSDAPPIESGEARSVLVCPDHADVIALEPGKCPRDNLQLMEHELLENQRVRWWCPMHPEVQADAPGHTCDECKGMKLVPRIVSYSPAGQVLAIPETSVVDMGTHKLAYVQRMPGTFDAVEVVLGPRSGDFFPVAKGLEFGQRVVTAGSFLVDAEARLNRNLAATYFGAAGSAAATSSDASVVRPASGASAEEQRRKEQEIAAALDELSAVDRQGAVAQRTCPVTGLRLGSMGKPEKLSMADQVVFVCCIGCEAELREHPEKYLTKIRTSDHLDSAP